MLKTAVGKVTRAAVDEEIEHLRQFVIAARSSADVETQATGCLDSLNRLYEEDKTLFSEEDVRWINVLRGYLAVRTAEHQPRKAHTKKAKRKGDQLDHCWRCLTPIDERFTDNCTTCSAKPYQWRICPVCKACGCQRAGTVLV
ncbi:hypothetical protein [Fimbriiglobus ruber]|uniref:Uncharacterized protein n=1 Tax=Fimbriiglobus ruber TaxID=1908690 RepID=A0A225DUZ1_9BACT|nr:hypothetical protein [Fimbriiglobus ruber]OWK43464.1 hypothetical protein FRUB_03063 [Fimbriiglobus ruber]